MNRSSTCLLFVSVHRIEVRLYRQPRIGREYAGSRVKKSNSPTLFATSNARQFLHQLGEGHTLRHPGLIAVQSSCSVYSSRKAGEGCMQ